eukprot:760264-Hanusia_phi.AAC.2
MAEIEDAIPFVRQMAGIAEGTAANADARITFAVSLPELKIFRALDVKLNVGGRDTCEALLPAEECGGQAGRAGALPAGRGLESCVPEDPRLRRHQVWRCEQVCSSD